jgi:spermidine synthase
MRRGVLYLLVFLSGVSALVYELVWQRLLHLVFGVSTLATSAVLAAFMGGLAIGGLLFGRRADRSARPLRLYALLEAGIALTALLVPPGLDLMTDVYTSLYDQIQPGLWGGACIRFVLTLAVLLLPATLIGATVPVMGRLARDVAGRLNVGFSLLYGVNTLGAVAGAALTGLVLLHYIGATSTLALAAGLNLVVAATAALVSLRIGDCGLWIEEEPLPSAANPHGLAANPQSEYAALLACALTTGAVTTGMEVVWTRILGVFTSNSAYAFALMLSVLLFGLGVGSFLQALWARRPGNDWRRLALCQALLAGLTLITLPCFRVAPAWLARCCADGSTTMLLLAELMLAASALFLPALLMGMSFPLLAAGLTGEPTRFGSRLGRLYAANTIGCVAGAFLAGFVLIPALGLHATLGLFVAGSLSVGLIAWTQTTDPRLVRVGFSTAAVLGAAAAWLLLPAGPFLKSPVQEPRHLLYYREGNNGTVSVVEESGGVRQIMVDGQPVAGTSETSVIDQKMLAHLPLLLHPDPHRALTVGFGSGGTSHSMTRHGIDVDCVEIEAAVADAADHFLSENLDVRQHPRFRLVLDDARSWLRVAPQQYDVIVTDCTNLPYKSNGDLYTVEYFQLMRDRLAPHGLAAAWVPANGIGGDDLKTLLRSFRAVFPHTSVWFMNPMPTDFLIVVGSPDRLRIDIHRLEQRLAVPAVRDDLAAVGLSDPCRLLYTFLTADEALDRYLGTGPLHTDDRPVLSYSTYGSAYRQTIAANLVELLSCRTDVARYVRGPAELFPLLRHYAASNEILLGHVAFYRGRAAEAFQHYAEGAKLLPADIPLRRLVITSYINQRQAG